MYSFHLYKHKQNLTAIKPAHPKSNSQLSERAYSRIEEWKNSNSQVAQELFGKVEKLGKLPKIGRENRKNRKSKERNLIREREQAQGTGNPYLENVFLDSLRKTNKGKHVGKYFLRVQYFSTEERLKNASCANSGLDSTSRWAESNGKERTVDGFKKQMVSFSHNNSFTPDPYMDPQGALLFRKREKSMEQNKTFFVTTKIPCPKSSLLISQKFSNFYKTLKGSKLYKNSII